MCLATGRYEALFDSFASSVGEMGVADTLFLLTDSPRRLARPTQRVQSVKIVTLPLGHLSWPLPTLWRYHAISSYESVIRSEVTHLLYSDVDMRPVGACDALWGETLVAVQHPGYLGTTDHHVLPFERNRDSRAVVSSNAESVYVAGGVQGGPVDAYMRAVHQLSTACLDDYLDGVQARWHDESHWNSFVASNRQDVTILPADYCWPEKWVPPATIKPRLLALDKDHHGLRGTQPALYERIQPLRLAAHRRLRAVLRR